jgi:hypothetical protein
MNQFDVSKIFGWDKYTGDSSSTCDDSVKLDCNILNKNTNIITRIGSESSDAVVYKVKIGQCNMAAKVLLHVEDGSQKNIQKEIAMAKTVSQQVTKNKTRHFPIVFGSTKCNNIIFPSQVAVQNSAQLLIDNAQKYQKKSQLSGEILFSELLWGDVNQLYGLLRKDPAMGSVFDNIIPQTFSAIHELHSLGISHNDLHFGNLLIRVDNTNMKLDTLIHDFGKSLYINDNGWTNDNILTDLHSINSAIIDREGLNNSKIGQKMKKMMEIVRSYKRNVPRNIYEILNTEWLKMSQMGAGEAGKKHLLHSNRSKKYTNHTNYRKCTRSKRTSSKRTSSKRTRSKQQKSRRKTKRNSRSTK